MMHAFQMQVLSFNRQFKYKIQRRLEIFQFLFIVSFFLIKAKHMNLPFFTRILLLLLSSKLIHFSIQGIVSIFRTFHIKDI